jgi:hypothetical protein
MRRHLLITAAVVVSLIPTGANATASAYDQGPAPTAPRADAHVPGEILLRFHPEAGPLARKAALAAVGGRIESTIERLRVHRVQLPEGGGVTAAITRLEKLRAVDFAEPNIIGTVATELVPDDRCFVGCAGTLRQWNLDAINAPAGWAVSPSRFYAQTEKAGLAAVKVAVLDTKVDIYRTDWRNADAGSTAQAFDARNGGQLDIVDAVDLLTNQNFDGQAAYHGTFVAGILGAGANNGSDIAGVAYNAQIMPITVVDGNGTVTANDLAAGIDHAVARGAKVINMSLVMGAESQTVKSALSAAVSKAVLVAAAGNSASDQPFYPAAYSEVMSVTASTEADRPAFCTNHSSRTSVAAPGSGIVSLDIRSGAFSGLSAAGCGTSTAAPHVSGLAALLIAQNPNRTPLQVRSIIESTADDDMLRPGFDSYFGNGRINIERALRVGSTPAEVRSLKTTIPVGADGGSVLTGTAKSLSSDPITEVRAFIGRISPDNELSVEAADGSFDSTTEQIRAQIPTSLAMPSGVRRIFVQARTATGWGPHSTVPLIIDRTPPSVKVEGSGPFFAIPAANIPGSITIAVTDDFSLQGKVKLVVSRAFGDGSVVYESGEMAIEVPSVEVLRWMPDIGASGLYRVKVYVTDSAGNPSSTQTDLVVLG